MPLAVVMTALILETLGGVSIFLALASLALLSLRSRVRL